MRNYTSLLAIRRKLYRLGDDPDHPMRLPRPVELVPLGAAAVTVLIELVLIHALHAPSDWLWVFVVPPFGVYFLFAGRPRVEGKPVVQYLLSQVLWAFEVHTLVHLRPSYRLGSTRLRLQVWQPSTRSRGAVILGLPAPARPAPPSGRRDAVTHRFDMPDYSGTQRDRVLRRPARSERPER